MTLPPRSASPDLRARVVAPGAEKTGLHAAAGPRRSRAVLAVVLIVLGVLLAPLAVAAGWAKWTLTDTERFVAAYAPLSRSPEVRTYVVDQTMTVVDAQIDVDGLTRQLADGLVALGAGPRASAALQTLQSTAASGLRSILRDGVSEFVASDQFDAAWAESLRLGHSQVVATLGGDPAAVAEISEDGSLGIPLAPIVERVKGRLVDRGITVAERIPTVDRSLVLVRSDQLPAVQLAYAATVAVGTWLPWVVLSLLVGGVAVAPGRRRALVWAAGGFAAGMMVLETGFGIGRTMVISAVPTGVLPPAVSARFYDAATVEMRTTAFAAAVLGLAVAVVAWWTGPSRTPSRLRALYGAGVDRLRLAGDEQGLGTGGLGTWVHRHRSAVFGLVAVLTGIAVATARPLTVPDVGWAAFWAVLAVVVVTLVERPERPTARSRRAADTADTEGVPDPSSGSSFGSDS